MEVLNSWKLIHQKIQYEKTKLKMHCILNDLRSDIFNDIIYKQIIN